jgi:low temperature requirement protein LtrA
VPDRSVAQRCQIWFRRMVPRDPEESRRGSTPLELFFDLCFVVAVAEAGNLLHREITQHHHLSHATLGYAGVFFAIWWAWMTFTWFSSAYDPDDDVYRLVSMVQIAGSLVLAAGVPRAFDNGKYALVTAGYVTMRLGNATHWIRVAKQDPDRRLVALRFAAAITVVQAFWIGRLALPPDWLIPSFVVAVVAELLIPLWAQRAGQVRWNLPHVAERYGHFTMIVLTESVLATTIAVRDALDRGYSLSSLFSVAAAAVVIFMAIWWLYFDPRIRHPPGSRRRTVYWGYGHYLVWASIAAVGVGLWVAFDQGIHGAHMPNLTTGYLIAVPIAVFLLMVWALQVRPRQRGVVVVAFPITATLVLLTPLTGVPSRVIAVLLAALVAATVRAARRNPDPFGPRSNRGGSRPRRRGHDHR